MPPWSFLDIPSTSWLWPFYLLFILPGTVFLLPQSNSLRSLLKFLLNEACPGTLLKLNLLPDTPYLVPFPLIFFLVTLYHIEYYLFSYLSCFSSSLPQECSFQEGRDFSLFVHCFISNAKKLPRHKRYLTDVLNEWIRSNLTNRILFLLLFLHKS